MKNTTIGKVLLMALVSLMAGMTSVSAQSHTVTGVVTADDGSAIIGANVLVVGSTQGTTTDVKGNYSIVVSEKASLEFSYLGYESQEVAVGKRTKINVTLKNDSQVLEDLVVVGYGVQRRSDVAGSVASIKAEDMNVYPSSNISEMLRGLSAGVQVSSSSGAPGSSASIQIRGSRSLSASNDPLYVIDGVPASATEFNMINNNDVASIEILKDAAAQAIYGARAANGVVMVTTKRGQSGKTEINFESTVSVQSLWRNFDYYDPEAWAELRRQAVANTYNLDTPEQIEGISADDVFSDPIMQRNWEEAIWTNWEKLMIKPAVTQKYSLGIRGGNKKLKVSANFGYYNQDGMIDGSGYERGNLRVNTDYEANKWLTIGVNTSANKTKRDVAYSGFNSFMTRSPYTVPFDEDGNIVPKLNSAGDTNPLYNMQHTKDQTLQDVFRINAFVELRPFKGFSYKFNATQYARFAEVGTYNTSQYLGGGGGGSISNSRDYNYVIENIVNYKVPIANKDHSLNLTAVQSWDRDYTTKLVAEASDVPVDSFWWNMIGDGIPTNIDRSVSESILVSYLARAQYSYKDRYIVNAAVRYDGSSRFGANNKWAMFPSIATAWRISEEPFLKDSETISNLKLRLSWGSVGNQNGIGNYTTLGTTTSYEAEFGDNYIIGYLPGNTIPNPKLRWETTTSQNFGLDFGFFDNRISGTVEYYLTNTTDLLVERQVESVLGYTKMLDNLGETKTSGFELTLNGDIIRKKDLNWSVGLNFSTFHNEIVRIDDRKDENGNYLSSEANKWFIGHPISVYYDEVACGIWQYEDFEGQNADGTWIIKPTIDSDGDGIADKAIKTDVVVEPGSVKVVDHNNDGVIDEKDRQIIERDPDFIASLNTSFRWKGFDLYMDWYAVYGSVTLNKYLYDYNSGGSLQGKLNGIKVNYWTPTNPSNEFPRPNMDASIPNLQSLCYQDSSYLRLRTVSVGYTLPQALLKKMNVNNLRVAFTATNLLTFTKYLSYNPETSAGSYPEPRQWAVSVNLNF